MVEKEEYFSLGGCAGPEMFEKRLLWLVLREYFSLGGCAGPEMLELDISLWEDVLVLEVKAWFSTGISWLLGFKWDLFLLSDVPPSVRTS